MRINKIKALHGYRTPRYVVSKPAMLTPNLLKRANVNSGGESSSMCLAVGEAYDITLYRRQARARGTRSRGAVAARHPGRSDTS